MDRTEFDLIAYLDDRQIDYKTSGAKNIGKGWVGIPCPMPRCRDHDRHCGINRTTKIFKCYLCGATGGIEYLISILEGCSIPKAETIMAEYPLDYPEEEDLGKPRKHTPTTKKIIIPDEATRDLPGLHKRYLESRGFDPDKISDVFRLYGCGTVGKYRGRIIAPHILNGRVVTFVARTIAKLVEPKYLNCSEDDSIVPVNRTLYNIDSVPEYGKGILVEGVTDVWRMGDGTMASCTSNITDDQKLMIAKKKLKRLFLMYDPDAEEKARKLAKEMNVIVPTYLIVLDSGDPADLSPDEARSIKRDLLG